MILFSVKAGTRSGNFGSMTMFLHSFSLIMHKILVNIHAFDLNDLNMGISSWNNTFV